jgi:hypothetical protein
MAINPAMIKTGTNKTVPTTRYGRAGLGPLFWGADHCCDDRWGQPLGRFVNQI